MAECRLVTDHACSNSALAYMRDCLHCWADSNCEHSVRISPVITRSIAALQRNCAGSVSAIKYFNLSLVML